MKVDDLIAAAEQQGVDVDEDTTWRVRYILTEECAIRKEEFHNPDHAFGREWSSIVCLNSYVEKGIADYSYPYARQDDGSWMMTGRVVADWSKVDALSIEVVK